MGREVAPCGGAWEWCITGSRSWVPRRRRVVAGASLTSSALDAGDGGVTDLAVGGYLAGYGFGDERLPVKTVPTLVMADDGGVFTSLPC